MNEGAPHTPQKKPNKAMEAIKEAARVLAVGMTLAGVPTDNADAMRYGHFNRSTNIEDARNTKIEEPTMRDLNTALISNKDPIANWNIDEPTTSLSVIEEEGRRNEPGPFDKDIEDAAKRIHTEIAAEEAAKQAKAEEEFEAYKKTTEETVKKESEQRPKVIVGQPKR